MSNAIGPPTPDRSREAETRRWKFYHTHIARGSVHEGGLPERRDTSAKLSARVVPKFLDRSKDSGNKRAIETMPVNQCLRTILDGCPGRTSAIGRASIH